MTGCSSRQAGFTIREVPLLQVTGMSDRQGHISVTPLTGTRP